MKILNEFIDFLRFSAAKILTAPLKLLCWLQTHSLNPFRKKKKELPQANYAVSASYAVSGSSGPWTTIATTASYISGYPAAGIQPMNQPSGQIFYMDFKQPGPERAINVHIQKD